MTFGAETTTDEVLEGKDLTGAWMLVTGASAGLGVETARSLAAHGADLILGVRDLDKAERNLGAVRAAGTKVEVRPVDLASLASVRAFSDGVRADHDRIDVLIANAGVMAPPWGTTTDGFETQFGTNHLGHFVLVNRLAPIVTDRIVSLSSAGHRISDVDLDDPNFERTPYDPWTGYGRSKTANVLFAVGLDRRLKDRGVRACAVHPGQIMTELSRHLTHDSLSSLIERRGDRKVTAKEIPAGAATQVWAGVVAAGDEVGGRYCEDCSVSGFVTDASSATGVMPYAVDPDRAEALWSRSEELVGESFAG
jgi:NAD(P)-dependent dehydrogenase (short-subunit alcohol dehydrogenase family)